MTRNQSGSPVMTAIAAPAPRPRYQLIEEARLARERIAATAAKQAEQRRRELARREQVAARERRQLARSPAAPRLPDPIATFEI